MADKQTRSVFYDPAARAPYAPDKVARENSLLEAVAGGKADEVRKLILQGATPNAVTSNGWPILHWAANRGHAEIARLLLIAGAKPNATDNRNMTALHHAADKGHVAAAQALLADGADINTGCENGHTPLHLAAREEQIGMLQLLLENGAKTGIRDEFGRTPLEYAEYARKPRAAAALRAHASTKRMKVATMRRQKSRGLQR